MAERKIPDSGYDNATRNRILDVATRLAAQKGFNAVSMRDIAKEVGIQMSSIYYYYDSKSALLEDILARFENGYRHYFDWLKDENMKADSLEMLMDTMFNKEFVEMRDPTGCLGISLLFREQHNHQSVRELAVGLLFEHSIRRLQADFDSLIKKGVIPQSDTKTLATIFMCCVIVCNELRLHEYAGAKPSVDCKAIYGDLKKFIHAALAQGVA